MKNQDEDVEIIVDTDSLSLCRLCINNKGKFQIGKQMQNNLKECFDINVGDDGMSHIICQICKNVVTEIVEVIKRFKNNQQILLDRRKQAASQLNQDERSASPICIESDGESKTIKPVGLKAETKPINQKVETIILETINKAFTQTPSIKEEAKKLETVKINEVNKKTEDDRVSLASSAVVTSPDKGHKDSDSETDDLSSIKKKLTRKKISNFKQYFSDSDGSTGKSPPPSNKTSPRRNYTNFKYNCLICCKAYTNKLRIRNHLKREHLNLQSYAKKICKPCSVPLRYFNVSQDMEKKDNWVQLKATKIIRFDPYYQFYFTTKFSTNTNKVVDNYDEDEDQVLKVEVQQQEHSKLLNVLEDIPVMKVRKNYSRLFGDEDDDDNASDKSETVPKLKLQKVRKPSHRPSVDSVKSKMSSDGVADIISDSDSVPATGNALPDDMKNPPQAVLEEQLNISEDEIKTIIKTCYKTIKLKKSMLDSNKKDWLTSNISEMVSMNVVWVNSPYIIVRQVETSEANTEDMVSKLPFYIPNKKASAQFNFRKYSPETLLDSHTPKQDEEECRPTITKLGKNQAIIRTKPRINHPSKLPTNPEPANKSPTVASNTLTITIDGTHPESNNKSNKRPMPGLIDAIPPKKPCLESQFNTMTPVIVSTVSLAKNVDSDNNASNGTSEKSLEECNVTSTTEALTSPPNDGIPMIKCKPTSLLMPSPIKKPEISANTANNPLTTMNNSMVMLNEYNNTDTENTLPDLRDIVNDNVFSAKSKQPQLLNSMFTSTTTPALLSNTNVVQPDNSSINNSGVIVTPLPEVQPQNGLFYTYSAQHNSVPYFIVQNPTPLAVDSTNEFIDINTQQFSTLAANDMPNTNTILSRLQKELLTKNITLRNSLLATEKFYRLLRFVLTIKEKRSTSDVLISSEYVIEVCLQTDNSFALNVKEQNNSKDLINISQWSAGFQKELITALKKSTFLITINNAVRIPQYVPVVHAFTKALDEFQL